MNPGAFRILNTLGLRAPQVYDLKDTFNRPPEKRYYLRFDKSSGLQNGVVSGESLRSDPGGYAKSVRDGILLKIEDTYESLGGGATLVKRIVT